MLGQAYFSLKSFQTLVQIYNFSPFSKLQSSNSLLRQCSPCNDNALQHISSLNGSGLEATTEGLLVQLPCPSSVIWEHMAQDCSRWFLNISGVGDSTQPVCAICSSAWSLYSKEVFPYIQVKLPVHWFLHIVSCPIAWHHQKEPGSIFVIPLPQSTF